MSKLSVNTIAHTGGATGLTVDSSGRVLQPVKPIFACHMDREVGPTDFSTVTTIPFNNIEFQQGGSNLVISGSGDTTGATFTAPITGAYHFNLVVNTYNATVSWNSIYLYIDNAQVNDLGGSASHDMTYRSIDNSGKDISGLYHTLSGSHVIKLNANQTVKPRILTSGDNSCTIRMGSRFSGFLIG
tara:strand:- start:50 stop:607 length:558 start_codon:yes stop_codon:yes gene_type:complete